MANMRESTNYYDKNNKEIHEGDIVIRFDVFGKKTNKGFPVIWNNEAKMWCVRCIDFNYTLQEYQNIYSLEIIGDIYKNRELLEI